MTLTKWDPRSQFRDEIAQLFDRFVGWGDNGDSAVSLAKWHPAVDFRDTEEAYIVTADLPGVSRENLKVQSAGNVLTISGERKSERSEDGSSERAYGKFVRSFTMPSAVDSEHISAELKDGVLTVTLPKSESAKPRQIAVS